MAGVKLLIDPEGAPFALSEENGFNLLSLKAPTAQAEKQWAFNADTEGELPAGSKDQNTPISPRLRLTGADEVQFRELQVAFDQKVGKLRGEGGILRIIFPDDSWIDWPVRDVTGGERLLDNRFLHSRRTEDEITFVCAPFGEGEEYLVGEFEFSGEAKRVLECLIKDVPGSADAFARAVITSPEADVWELLWGKESRLLSEASTALPQYAPGALVPQGGATLTTATVDGKAGTPVIRQGTLTPNWTAMADTGPLTHEGVYEIIAWIHMPATNTGQVGIGFEYGVGDMVHRVSLAPFYFDADHYREGKVVMVHLGQVFIEAAGRGDHRWEGRVLARSTIAGDDLDILDFALRPLAEANGRVSIEPVLNQPSALLARDEFPQSAGPLNEQGLAAAGAISGPRSPGTVADDAGIGQVAWSSPSNAKASDDSRASATLNLLPISETKPTSHFLKATNFGFALPEGSTVTGIVVEVERSTDGDVRDYRARIVKGGVIGGNESERAQLSALPFGDAYRAFGSATDLWGQTWTVADINASGFGFAYAASLLSNGPSTAYVDHIRITVYYTDAAGQKWATTGDADDIAVETAGKTAQRTAVSDANINTGRYAIAGTTVTKDVVASITSKRGGMEAGASEKVRRAVLARYVDTNNWLMLCIDADHPSSPLTQAARIVKRVAGTVTELGKVAIPAAPSIWQSLWLQVDRRGRYFCWGTLTEGGVPRLLLAGQDNDLKEGGTLDDGRNGFYDSKTGALANTRNYDQFVVWVPTLDAVIYQGLSMELSHNACQREVQGGGTWADIPPEGDYLKLAPAGAENRKNRLVFIASPHDPDLMGVGFPSKLKVAIYATPRYRTVPDPA